MFSFLQRVGKALMTPIAVLPAAALLLRFGFGDIFTGEIAAVMKAAGEAIFGNLDLLFGMGIAYGLAKNNDGTAALSGAVGVLTAKAVYTHFEPELNTGVFVGIVMGVLGGLLYNRYHKLKLPDYLGFFSGKRFVALITVFVAVIVGAAMGMWWHYVQDAINAFSHAVSSAKETGTFLYGMLNRLLIPFGLHHILNSVFWFQLGEFHYLKEGADAIANGDLHRFFAGDPDAGVYMAGFYVPMMFGLPALALAIYLNTPKAYRKKAGALLFSVAFTSFLTGITEPIEFMFMFAAPPLYALHALLTGAALAAAQALDIHAGFGFSAGLIDFIINYKLGKNVWMLIPLGLVFALIYFTASYMLLRFLRIDIIAAELHTKKENETNESDEARAFIEALGGEANIIRTDACITRLRMQVHDTSALHDEAFIKLGAKGVIRPDKHTIQIVLGAKAESIADAIKKVISR
jgi:PTS system N-acetylglucosamine-specific IIC component